MKLNLALLSAFTCMLSAIHAQMTTPVPFDRLNKNDSLLVILDLQVGLFDLVRDFDPTVYRNNIIAHAAIGQLFDLPVVMTTSAQQGPNGPLPKEILEMYPDAPLIMRQGEVDAWDNPAFQGAVRAANKSQIILAGIVTDPNPPLPTPISHLPLPSLTPTTNPPTPPFQGTTFAALSLRSAGYSVWANVEASGTTTHLIADTANLRMMNAGVNLVSLFAIVCDLMRDWRDTPGSAQVLPWLDRYFPVYGFVARGHGAAVENGTLVPGEEQLLG
ncbi:hypothetical protein MMC15_004191 [Xylographa vitiligo]|nr:hypothetical protein [Xylographa vitiligo]